MLKTHSGCQHYVTQAPAAKTEHWRAQHHRPYEEQLLLRHCSSGQHGRSSCRQELIDQGILTQGISGQKDSHFVQLKKPKCTQKCSGDTWSVQLDALRASLASYSPNTPTNTPGAGAVFGPHSWTWLQLASEQRRGHTGCDEVFG